MFVIFNLLKLDEQNVVEFTKVLGHIIDGYTSFELEVYGLNSSIEFALH